MVSFVSSRFLIFWFVVLSLRPDEAGDLECLLRFLMASSKMVMAVRCSSSLEASLEDMMTNVKAN